MSGINFRKHFRILSSAALIFTLMFAALGFAIISIVTPARVASAQTGSNMQVSFVYTYVEDNNGDKKTAKFTSSAILSPVTGGFAGNSTGTYEGLDVASQPSDPCTQPQETSYSGSAGLVVHAQYSIDNPVTGGPDTTMYNSSTTVLELIFRGDNVSAHAVNVPQQGEGDSSKCGPEDWTTSEGADCHFYGIDFSVVGTFQKTDEDSPYATCSVTITPAEPDLKIFGTVSGLFGAGESQGLSNSKVVLAKLDDMKRDKLSVSKPDFIKETATLDNATANYEFKFNRGPGKLPAMLVVSLLWYEGKPEFAITNGAEAGGRLIPVYQALCVDDNPQTKCEKWKDVGSGNYEAEVNFEYGSADKLKENWEVVPPEDWVGSVSQHASNSQSSATLDDDVVPQIMADSAYMYYNTYRAMKFFDTLGLKSQLQPLVIRSHDMDPHCPDSLAWYNGKSIDPGYNRSFGDLGTFTHKVQASGGEIVMCDYQDQSSLNYFSAPKLPLWHELGHYLHFQMYDPDGIPRGNSHEGYNNTSSNDSFIEGFASFVAMLIDEYYGGMTPQFIYYDNLEVDYKIWDPWNHEENAVSGILWDLHDKGKEIDLNYNLNGTATPVSKVYRPSVDEVSLSASKIIGVIENEQPRTVLDLYYAFGRLLSPADNDMIFVNHGVFADVVIRNYIHDSAAEKVGESGSSSSPQRLIRGTPPPLSPGSYIVTDRDAVYNITLNFDDQYSYYDYSYLSKMKAGEKVYFVMPPTYYPSVATITPASTSRTDLSSPIKITSDEYWNYIQSRPPKDGIFKHISVNGSPEQVSAAQYIQNVKSLLNKVSKEYKAGNATGAETLANAAYTNNFGHIGSELVARNSTNLKIETEQLLRVELVNLIKAKADSSQIDAKISEINTKLDEAAVVVPEFPAGIAAIMLSILVGSIILFSRGGRGLGFCFK